MASAGLTQRQSHIENVVMQCWAMLNEWHACICWSRYKHILSVTFYDYLAALPEYNTLPNLIKQIKVQHSSPCVSAVSTLHAVALAASASRLGGCCQRLFAPSLPARPPVLKEVGLIHPAPSHLLMRIEWMLHAGPARRMRRKRAPGEVIRALMPPSEL